MVLQIEVKKAKIRTHYPFKKGVDVVFFKMLDTFKDFKEVVPQINVVEAFEPMQALLEVAKNAHVHFTEDLPFIHLVMH